VEDLIAPAVPEAQPPEELLRRLEKQNASAAVDVRRTPRVFMPYE